MASQSFLYNIEGQIIETKKAIKELSDALDMEIKQEGDGGVHTENLDTWGTVLSNALSLKTRLGILIMKLEKARETAKERQS